MRRLTRPRAGYKPRIELKIVGFCRTSDFSFTNFVEFGFDRILMLIYQTGIRVQKNAVRSSLSGMWNKDGQNLESEYGVLFGFGVE